MFVNLKAPVLILKMARDTNAYVLQDIVETLTFSMDVKVCNSNKHTFTVLLTKIFSLYVKWWDIVVQILMNAKSPMGEFVQGIPNVWIHQGIIVVFAHLNTMDMAPNWEPVASISNQNYQWALSYQ